jgi:hypothetical protein
MNKMPGGVATVTISRHRDIGLRRRRVAARVIVHEAGELSN